MIPSLTQRPFPRFGQNKAPADSPAADSASRSSKSPAVVTRRQFLTGMGATAGVAALGVGGWSYHTYLSPRYPGHKPENVIGTPDNTFFVIGDMGTGSEEQYRIGEQIFNQPEVQAAIKEGRGDKIKIFTTGDNLYYRGEWKKYGHERFEKPYAALLAAGVQFVPVYGNHDLYGGKVHEQLAYFEPIESGLNNTEPNRTPDRLYTTARLGDVEFFLIDTIGCDPNLFRDFPYAEWVKQQAWLVQKFEESDAKFKIILGHHPSRTTKNANDRQRALNPVIQGLHPDAYISGHHHGYERFDPDKNNGVTYLVTAGGGAWMNNYFSHTYDDNQVRLNIHHVMKFVAGEDQIRFSTIGQYGEIIDSGEINPNPNR